MRNRIFMARLVAGGGICWALLALGALASSSRTVLLPGLFVLGPSTSNVNMLWKDSFHRNTTSRIMNQTSTLDSVFGRQNDDPLHLPVLLEEKDAPEKADTNTTCSTTHSTNNPVSFLIRSGSSWMAWYRNSLDTHPVLTKSITASFMAAVGDVVAQWVEMSLPPASAVGDTVGWDVRRTLSLAVEGCVISGPFMHYGYELLEDYFPVFQDNKSNNNNNTHNTWYFTWFMVVCQVLVDALLMDSIMVATAIITSSCLEGQHENGWRGYLRGIRHDLQVSWISSVFWSPVQLLSFKYVPLPFRVAAVNLQDIAWFATISYMSHRCRNHHPAEKTKEH